ncbi:MAG: type II toxin-antitoxin system RelE/ParE family toxin [Cohaesibacter sp.]|nr:type II toxin-antitoxin system RelE/ParE family toxin [Cohaesibacter sp.]MCV6601159.1 type II toxin-antitoxin system RelE/ParE family toxin [Cohaesibacter sp.]
MVWTIRVQPEAEDDLALIYDFLFQSYLDFGEAPDDAQERVVDRIRGITKNAYDLAQNPYCGTKRNDFGDGIRNITQNKAIIWFHVDEATKTVSILAFFFGGQDHVDHMLERLLSGK